MDASFVFCPSCGKRKSDTSGASTSSATNANAGRCDSFSGKPVAVAAGASDDRKPSTTPTSFSSFMKEKEAERRSHFEPKSKKARSSKDSTKGKAKEEKGVKVLINVGLMEYECGEPKVLRGKTFPVKLLTNIGYEEVFENALKKWEDYDKTFSCDRGYILTYPDARIARRVPGSSIEFSVRKYKEGLGKAYSRISMFLCPVDEIKETSTIRPITNWMMEDEPGEEYFSDSVGDYVDEMIDLTCTVLDSDVQTLTDEQESLAYYAVEDFL